MKSTNNLFIIIFLLVSCYKECKIDHLSNSDFVKGVNLEDCHINYFQHDLYNYKTGKLENPIRENQHSYYFVATSNPYLCGGCRRVGLDFIRQLSYQYPAQVKFVVSDYYRKDTNKSIVEIENKTNLDIYMDINGDCIKYLYEKSNLLTEAWYLIIDQFGIIVYAVAKPYEFEYNLSESEIETIINIFYKYLNK